jgi:glutamine kinase
MQVHFGTKAETLERLAPVLKTGRVLPMVRTSVLDWRQSQCSVLDSIVHEHWGGGQLIVRSSAADEDGNGHSLAGHYCSVSGVQGRDELRQAIEEVIASFSDREMGNQVFVQPCLTDVKLCGVAFSCDPNCNAPYLVINYDRKGSTNSVTSGATNDVETFYCYRNQLNQVPDHLKPIASMVMELMSLFGTETIDVEFAIDVDAQLYLLQVRPLGVQGSPIPDATQHAMTLSTIACKVAHGVQRHPYLHGDRTLFGVMPDWNPAEIIGIRPRPLALSLYKDLVTDSIWAYQRHNYGYRNLRSFPLMVDFHGLPYIDVRVSFNSFVPADVESGLANRLVNHYLDLLAANPSRHDKVEFEIVHSCYTLDLPERLEKLRGHGFTVGDQKQLTECLRRLTNRIIHGKSGLWLEDTQRLDELKSRYETMKSSSLDHISRIYWLLEDCKRYGTLPFAGLARAAFIAVQFLRSMVTVNVLDRFEMASFLGSLDTVSSQISADGDSLRPSAFLEKYGHLRPGTYDITSPRYDEAPDQYFDWSTSRLDKTCPHPTNQEPEFALSLRQLKLLESLLQQHGLEHDVLSLFHFLKSAIEGREHAKFLFTRNLSLAMSLIRELGLESGLSIEDCSYLDINVLRQLYASGGDVSETLHRSVQGGRERYAKTRQILLPPLISSPDDVYGFHLTASDPNYITLGRVTAPVRSLDDELSDLPGSILFIPSADPGFDWIFSHRIGGLVTMYGGANSHMAIRASELGIPAVIGAGSPLFEQWKTGEVLELDCANRQVHVVRFKSNMKQRLAA